MIAGTGMASLLLLTLASAAAPSLDFAAIPALTERDTVAAAQLAPQELQQIIDHLETTSFDTPDSWEAELRMRPVSIGGAQGLIVRGSKLLCGGTGNCATWLFRRDSRRWMSLLDGEAPVVASAGFSAHQIHGLPDLVLTVHESAATSLYAVYVFDGKLYQRGQCYEVTEKSGSPGRAARQIACR